MKVLLTPSKKQEENVYIYLDYKSLNIIQQPLPLHHKQFIQCIFTSLPVIDSSLA